MKQWIVKSPTGDRRYLDEETAMQVFEACNDLCSISTQCSITGIEQMLQYKTDWENLGTFETENYAEEDY